MESKGKIASLSYVTSKAPLKPFRLGSNVTFTVASVVPCIAWQIPPVRDGAYSASGQFLP